jgi:hypothetical protein
MKVKDILKRLEGVNPECSAWITTECMDSETEEIHNVYVGPGWVQFACATPVQKRTRNIDTVQNRVQNDASQVQ